LRHQSRTSKRRRPLPQGAIEAVAIEAVVDVMADTTVAMAAVVDVMAATTAGMDAMVDTTVATMPTGAIPSLV
jgi:hypothetical protein